MRVLQGIGGAFLFANSSAILTDAFPAHQRGLALGINNVAGIAGSFIGLVIGGLLAPVNWHLIFLVSVPFGMFGTIWAYLQAEGHRRPAASHDRLVGQHHVRRRPDRRSGRDHVRHPALRRPHHGLDQPLRADRDLRRHRRARRSSSLIERRVKDPMFHLDLFRIRAFTAGNIASLLAALGRGGLQFILIIWLQGIWLPLHGYSFERTPLWAGIYLLPLTVGFLLAAPLSGLLSDRFGARPFATGGMIVAARQLRCSCWCCR